MNTATTTVLLVGLCTVDLVQRVAELPAPGAKLQSTSVATVAGGPAANAAVTVAALGGRAQLVTVLGRHPLATMALDDLGRHGVHVMDTQPDRIAPPPVSAVLVREWDGERVVVSHNSARIAVDGQPDWPGLLAGAGALLVDGQHATLGLAAARAARALDVPVILDAGSDKPVLAELLPLVDVCACSAVFRWRVAGERETERAVHDVGVPVVMRTDGAGPVRWSVRDGRTEHSGSAHPPTVAARDTLGAGDVWHGALAHGIAELGRVPGPSDLPGLVAEANRVAAIRVARVGAREWLDHLRDHQME